MPAMRPSSECALAALLEKTPLTARRGLARAWRKLGNAPTDAALAAWRKRVDAARERYATRAASVPEIRIDESLPIAARTDQIIASIRRYPVLVLAGETGSGKSTQLPKLCLAAGRGVAGLIGCTQPRRVAARSVARRVAAELGTEVGALVGYQVRFAEKSGERTLIKFMTDGILLAETQSDPWLNAYDTIVLDEAHERSLNIDFLLGYLKQLLVRRTELKLIVTSATIDTKLFSQHFNDAPIVEVEGRSYPVEVRWRPDESGEIGPTERIAAALDEITAEDPRGDVLVFLPGEREIRDTHLALTRRRYHATEILALYARLSANEQDRVFRPGPGRRIVLATNVAETSLTVPRIRYVIDTGTARVKRYSPRNQLERLHIEPIAQSAAEQRKGRCGRVGSGICIRLYSEEDFATRPLYADPEILRSSLAGTILRMLDLKLGDVEKFPFVETPDARAIGDGYRRLAELGAVDEHKRLTPVGDAMARWPIDVALARMLIEARRLGGVRELLIVTAFLSIQDPRERPADARQAADAAHAVFADKTSDFIGVLNLWHAHALAHEEFTQSKLRDWCREHFLSYLRMREWRELHRQLLLLTPELDRAQAGEPASFEAIHRCLLSGWPTQVARKDEQNQFRGTRERKFAIFPGSALAKQPPQWLLAGQILDLQKVYAMQCARVEPKWIEQQAAHLVKRAWRDPHWSRKRGAVLAFEQVTLFGLTLVEKRVALFCAQDPAAAHAIFLREALARGEIDCRADCVRANARVLAQAHELEAKQRHAGLVKNEGELVEFFAGKLPEDIDTAAAFDAWYRRATPAQQSALRWPMDFVLVAAPGIRASDFPAALEFPGRKLKLDYRFVPGDIADGVTLQVPLAFVNAVSAARCEWLVPGLLPDKIAEMIRGLPKSLRRNFVPAPDFALAFVAAEPPREQLLAEALATYLARVTGVAVTAADFADIVLPPHLTMRFRVHDEKGAILIEGRDLGSIRAQWGESARTAFSRRADTELTREDVSEFDTDIPDSVRGESGLVAYPALVDLGDAVALRVFERADEATVAHRGGVERLLRHALREPIKQSRRQLPIRFNQMSLLREAQRSLPLSRLRERARGEGRSGNRLGEILDCLREDIAEAALTDLLAARDLDLRDRAAFGRAEADLARELFPACVERLKIVEDVLAAYAELTPWLDPPLLGYARANYDDLHEQLDALVYPGFVRHVEPVRLSHFPRYLKAMRLRAERLRQDAARDQARMLTVRVYWSAYLKFIATTGVPDPALTQLRWLIEELRVSVFAQELKTAEPVSPKRLAKLVETLRAES
ncbi:MAG: ATP-dependent RNA helicase HrpA [Rudaea sp.]